MLTHFVNRCVTCNLVTCQLTLVTLLEKTYLICFSRQRSFYWASWNWWTVRFWSFNRLLHISKMLNHPILGVFGITQKYKNLVYNLIVWSNIFEQVQFFPSKWSLRFGIINIQLKLIKREAIFFFALFTAVRLLLNNCLKKLFFSFFHIFYLFYLPSDVHGVDLATASTVGSLMVREKFQL